MGEVVAMSELNEILEKNGLKCRVEDVICNDRKHGMRQEPRLVNVKNQEERERAEELLRPFISFRR